MYIEKHNLTNIKYNWTNGSVGEYKSIFNILNFKKRKRYKPF